MKYIGSVWLPNDYSWLIGVVKTFPVLENWELSKMKDKYFSSYRKKSKLITSLLLKKTQSSIGAPVVSWATRPLLYPHTCHPQPGINQVRTKVKPPRDMPPPHEMCHPLSHMVHAVCRTANYLGLWGQIITAESPRSFCIFYQILSGPKISRKLLDFVFDMFEGAHIHNFDVPYFSGDEVSLFFELGSDTTPVYGASTYRMSRFHGFRL